RQQLVGDEEEVIDLCLASQGEGRADELTVEAGAVGHQVALTLGCETLKSRAPFQGGTDPTGTGRFLSEEWFLEPERSQALQEDAGRQQGVAAREREADAHGGVEFRHRRSPRRD